MVQVDGSVGRMNLMVLERRMNLMVLLERVRNIGVLELSIEVLVHGRLQSLQNALRLELGLELLSQERRER